MAAFSILVGLVLLWSGAARADAPVVVEAREGIRPTVAVRATGDPVHLPSCRGVVWERFDPASGGYLPLSEEPCGAMQPATPIDASGREFTVEADLAGVQVVRPVVVVGTGCQPGLPLPAAGCAVITSLPGPIINVRAAPPDGE